MQNKPRIRCRHYTPSNPMINDMLVVRSATDDSPLASFVTSWQRIQEVASQALSPEIADERGRFHPQHVIQTAITLN